MLLKYGQIHLFVDNFAFLFMIVLENYGIVVHYVLETRRLSVVLASMYQACLLNPIVNGGYSNLELACYGISMYYFHYFKIFFLHIYH